MAESDGSGVSSSKNFRSSYYEKLGFCGNEDKNLLDSMLLSNPFDLEKLNDIRERLDGDKRCVSTWKILLGVECGRNNPFDEYANVKRIRSEHFLSLKHHLEVLLKYNIVMRNRLKKNHVFAKNDSETITSNDELSKSVTSSDVKHQSEECSQPSNSSSTDVIYSHQVHDIEKQSSENIDERSPDDERSYIVQDEIKKQNHVCTVAKTNPSVCQVYDQGFGISGCKEDSNSSTTSNLLDDIESNFLKKSNPCRQITLMYLLDAGQLNSSDLETQLSSDHCQKLFAMALFFVNIANDLQEAFFLFRNLTRKYEEAEAAAANADSTEPQTITT